MFFKWKSVYLNHMHAGLVLPCFGDRTALYLGCREIEILPPKHTLRVKRLLCYFGTRDLRII